MKKIAFMALAAGVLALAASCGRQKSADSADTADTAAVEIQEAQLITDSVADSFRNPDNQAEIATDSTYAVTPTGLKYMVEKQGTGVRPGPTSEVTVHYTGRLLDGTVFDSSVARGEPATFPLDRVIAGWTEGLQLMQEGSKYTFYIPSDLAYGAQGAPGSIPPYSDLIFEVELIKVQ